MTNTKPTWEELKKELLERDKMFKYAKIDTECLICGIDSGKLVKYIDDIIQKVEQEAYERGYKNGLDIDLNPKMDYKNYMKWIKRKDLT